MESNQENQYNKNLKVWVPSPATLSSEKGGLVSISADLILAQAEVGYVLTFRGEPIAKVTLKNSHQVMIKDKHSKHWLINFEQLKGVDFLSFSKDLADAIERFQNHSIGEQTARNFLAKMSVGDHLCYGNETLATLVEIMQPTSEHGTILTFEAGDHSRHIVSIDTIPAEQSISDYLESFDINLEQAEFSQMDSLLIRYFREEFVNKMLIQMTDDHRRNGDTWLSRYENGVESYIHQRFDEYFKNFEEAGKPIPWLKIAGYAILAQAREDHPEWLL